MSQLIFHQNQNPNTTDQKGIFKKNQSLYPLPYYPTPSSYINPNRQLNQITYINTFNTKTMIPLTSIPSSIPSTSPLSREQLLPLINSRILQKNLAYFIGLSSNLLQKENQLKSVEYFGQYGTITKLVLNKNKTYNSNGPNGPSFACYVTYSNEKESSLAILSMENSIIDNHIIKASFGTTKYCLNFLRNSVCNNKDCIYLHYIADKKDILSREKMNSDKEIFNNQRIRAIEMSQILTKEVYEKLKKANDENKEREMVFPRAFKVYEREIVVKYIEKMNLKHLLDFQIPFPEKKEEEIKIQDKKENIEIISKKYINISNINKFSRDNLYQPAKHSRFNFANQKANLFNKNEVPEQINKFISQQFIRHSNLFNKEKEQNELNDYYFSLKPNSLDSNDSWNSLISTLKMWNDFNENDGTNTNNNEDNYYVSINKFSTY